MIRIFTLAILSSLSIIVSAQTIVYHDIVRDNNNNLISWYNPNKGSSFNHVLELTTDFWKNIPTCCGNHKYYMVDHTWSPQGNSNKIGGDQHAMALSSWALFYAYSGDSYWKSDMTYIADTYLANSLSPDTALWANLPYPCNFTTPYLPKYDGDYILGKNYTQPDKAGSFGAELVKLYKITAEQKYLDAAVKIANTLAKNVSDGDSLRSPYPFKVNAINGTFPANYQTIPGLYFTANVVPTLLLFEELKKMNLGNITQFDTATNKVIRWVKRYPLQNNNWGCFFENIYFPSNASTNAVTMAMYILEHQNSWGNTWQQDSRKILDDGLALLGSNSYDTLGVTAIFEQTADFKEGGSHTSRFGSIELLYAEQTGDTSRVRHAIRQLDWATYLVDFDGKCRFSPRNTSIWYTDGYGDYVRHYLRAMGYYPPIAFDSANHLIRSTSVVRNITYQTQKIEYDTYDADATETFRLTSKPLLVKLNGQSINEASTLNNDSWTWTPYAMGGVLKVKHTNSKNVELLWSLTAVEKVDEDNFTLDVFPNPVQTELFIKSSSNEKMNYSISNLLNQTIQSGEVNRKINVDALQRGVYLLTITQGKNTTTKKVIKQ